LLTYDITSMDSFLNLNKWHSEVVESAEPDALIFLVGNKCDKEEDREVSTEKGQKFATDKGLSGFFETSAKSGVNVELTFVTAARRLFKKYYRKILEEKCRSDKPKGKKLSRAQTQDRSSTGCGC
jgi:GTPase SAR1 family protein